MAGVNKVFLIGNVGSVDVRENVARISLATSSSYKNKSGELVEQTEWHRCVIFGKLIDVVRKYVKKGDKLHIEGSIKYGKYTDDQGVEHHTTDVNVKNLQMLGGRRDAEKPEPQKNYNRGGDYSKVKNENHDFMDDDIPSFA